MARPSDLNPFFYPETIAVIGASADAAKPSGIVLMNLLNSFQGKIYPVNPKHTALHGIPCFPSVTAIPGKVSLSILITPPAIIPELLKEHAAKDIHHVIIASAGFAETETGAELERDIQEISDRLNIRIIGPNCLGVFHPSAGLDTFFLPHDRVSRPREGCISIISQSGSILGLTMILLAQEGLGIAKAVSYGNRVDVGEAELLEYLSADEETKVIGLCIESVRDGRRFIRAAQKCNKPIVVMKLGQEPAGKKASRSHTGSISGEYEIFQAAFRRSGVSEARTIEEFLDLLKVFSMQKPRPGQRVLILTNAGGVSVMAADHCNQAGLDVPDLPAELKERLRAVLPPYYSLTNPIDLTGNSTDDEFALVLRTCLDSFDAAILIPFMTVPGVTPNLGEVIIRSLEDHEKPVISLHPYARNGERFKEAFTKHGIPILPTPIRIVQALSHLLRDRSVEPLSEGTAAYPAVTSMLRMKKGTDLFSVDEKHRFLDALQIRYPKAIRAKTQAEAILAAQTIGLPVALKIASPEILHKTDAGGVRLDIRSAGELRKAYGEVTRSAREYRPDARILGVDVEEMVPPGVEVIIGGIRDPQFGPVVMCGLGGIFVETTRDVVFEIAPVTCNGARRMLESIRGYPVLKGVRGRQGVDLESLTKVIVSISEVIASHPEIDEIELNPLMAYPSGVIAVDARIIPASGPASGKEPTH